MFLNKYCIKKAWLLFPLMLLSALLHSQESPDSLPRLMQDVVIDTVVAEPSDEDEPAEGVVSNNIYFLQKTMQANGGGPDSMRWKKLPDTLVKSLKADQDFWYVNYVF